MKSLVRIIALLFAFLPLLWTRQILPAQPAVFFHDNFASLDNWKPFAFPKIKSHSTYTLVQMDRATVLKTESKASASAIVHKESFNVYDYPVVRWRWRVENVYAGADATRKDGDDYSMRVYVMFEYDPGTAGFGMKLKYGLAKALYGVYPPDSSLSYVWANRKESQRILNSPYTDRAKMIFLQEGTPGPGVWHDEQIDILEDYQKAFGTKSPVRARIAIMNDSDDTGEHSVSYMDFIEVAGRQ